MKKDKANSQTSYKTRAAVTFAAAAVLLISSVVLFILPPQVKNAQNSRTAEKYLIAQQLTELSLNRQYGDEFKALHSSLEAQAIRFDEMAGLLTQTKSIIGADKLYTVSFNGQKQNAVYVLDADFSRSLKPNVDYKTLGSIIDAQSSFYRALSVLPTQNKKCGYFVFTGDNGKPVLAVYSCMTATNPESYMICETTEASQKGMGQFLFIFTVIAACLAACGAAAIVVGALILKRHKKAASGVFSARAEEILALPKDKNNAPKNAEEAYQTTSDN